jgi:hypothetical protein
MKPTKQLEQPKTYADLLKAPWVEFTHLSASALTDKEIDKIFKSYPWCCYLCIQQTKIISREGWEQGVY